MVLVRMMVNIIVILIVMGVVRFIMFLKILGKVVVFEKICDFGKLNLFGLC